MLDDKQLKAIKKRLDYVEDNNLFDSHLINDIKQLFSTIEGLKGEVERLTRLYERERYFTDTPSNVIVESLRAEVERYQTALERIERIGKSYVANEAAITIRRIAYKALQVSRDKAPGEEMMT